MQTQKKRQCAGLAYKFKELSEDLFEELSDEKSSRVCGGEENLLDKLLLKKKVDTGASDLLLLKKKVDTGASDLLLLSTTYNVVDESNLLSKALLRSTYG